MFDKMKQLLELQRKVKELKHELESSTFEMHSPDGLIRIAMSGAQEVQQVTIKDNLQGMDKVKLESAIKDTYNMAIKRSQELAAEKMKGITGLNLPGLL